MTYHKDVYLTCDSCYNEYGVQMAFKTAKMARQNAAKAGWVNRGATDLCPECGNSK